jgi:hypothetical protein
MHPAHFASAPKPTPSHPRIPAVLRLLLLLLLLLLSLCFQVLSRQRTNYEARFIRAQLYEVVGEPAKAQQQYTYLLMHHPGHPDVRASVCMCVCV